MITVMNADGAESRDVAPSLDVQGVVDWAPDGTSIVAGATDAEGPGVFVVRLDDGTARRLTKGLAGNPAWSPSGNLIVYAGPNVGGRQQLLAVRPDGTPVPLPAIDIGTPGTRMPRQGYRFLQDGTGLVYTPAVSADLEFWLLNLATNMTRRVARFTQADEIRTFDLAPDGKQIIFDRLRDNADIVLIERKQTTPRE